MAPAIVLPLVPLVPALPYLFVIAVSFGMLDGFSSLSGHEILVLLIYVAASIVTDHSAGLLGAKYGGAHTKSLFWGIGGAIIGLIAFPPFGSLAGLFFGVLMAELCYMKTRRQALKAASGALLGAAAGMAINVALAIAFISTFIFFVAR